MCHCSLQIFTNLSFLFCQSRTFLEPLEIFKGEVEETIEKVELARGILKHFRETYEHHRLHIRDYFKEKDPRSWEFAPQLVFHRFDKFVERVDMVHVSNTLMQACFVCFPGS